MTKRFTATPPQIQAWIDMPVHKDGKSCPKCGIDHISRPTWFIGTTPAPKAPPAFGTKPASKIPEESSAKKTTFIRNLVSVGRRAIYGGTTKPTLAERQAIVRALRKQGKKK